MVIPDGLFPEDRQGILRAAERQVAPNEDLDLVVEHSQKIAQKVLTKIRISHELIHLLRGEKEGTKYGSLSGELVEKSIGYFSYQVVDWLSRKPQTLERFEEFVGNGNLAKKIILTNELGELPRGFTYR